MRRRPGIKAADRTSYDAEAAGALCKDCRFKALGASPVRPPQGRGKLVIVDSYPTAYDDKAGHEVPTRASRLLDNTLTEIGATDVCRTWATLCHPPETSDESDLKQAIGCCKPRLERELEQSSPINETTQRRWILALGDEAFWVTTGKMGSSESWKGSPVASVFANTKVLPSYQPRHVLSKEGRKLGRLFYKHVERAVAFAVGQLGDFEWPADIVDDGPELDACLESLAVHAEAGGEYAFDIETRGLDLTSDISCISFATPERSCCVQLPSRRYDALIRRILSSGHAVGQNISAFDRRCLAKHGYELTPYYEDTLLAASILDPQLPKNLGALVGAEFHADAHKASFKADKETGILQGDWLSTDPEVERARRIYCLRDSYTTLLVWHVQRDRLALYGKKLYQDLKLLDRVMLRLRESGCEWDFLAAAELDAVYSEKRAASLTILQNAAASLGLFNFNPASPKQVGDLFYVKCGIAPFKWTDSGAPSTDEDVLTELLKSDNEFARKFAIQLLDFREADKALGTYIRGMAPTLPETRVYGEWRAHTTPTGRFSCTGVPLQTLGAEMRRLIKASPGKLMVEADLAGAELRTVALFANERTMLQIFADGDDLYSIIARQMFQDPTIAKGHKLRQLAKTVILASNYGAAAETAYGVIVKDESIRRNFPDLTVRQVKAMQNAYFKVCPRIPLWWDEEAEDSLARGYYLDPTSGAKLYFWGPVDRSLMANFPNQSAVARYMNHALLRIDSQLEKEDMILTCVHDAITIETSKERIKLVESLLHKEMTGLLSLKGRSVDMVVESKIGATLDAVK